MTADNGVSPITDIHAKANQDYLLLVLADSNLPTGGFVASAGLEACWAHGLLKQWHDTDSTGTTHDGSRGLVVFLRSSLDTYARSVAGFLVDVHRTAWSYIYDEDPASRNLDTVVADMIALDQAYNVILLNHVAQRASRAQGIALLTLHSKSFAQLQDSSPPRQGRAAELLQELKKQIRLGALHGHLPICFAAFMAALGIDNATRVLEVHLFLQARAILSSAVRLNIVGPYQMHRILAFDAKGIIDDAVMQSRDCTVGLVTAHSHFGASKPTNSSTDELASISNFDTKGDPTWDWSWGDEGAWTATNGSQAPKTTWPLGDLMQGRHDQLHSRLFNS